jgi:hypothetical protein
MKKSLATISLALTLLAGFSLPAQAAKVPSAGAQCTSKGSTAVVKNNVITNQSTTFTCTKLGKKMVWDKGVINLQVKSLLNVSQKWSGSSVALSILDSNGLPCDTYAVGTECYGFYLGWSANFNDSDRKVSYANNTTIISGLQQGDKGAFELMYQQTPGPNGTTPLVVKQFAFNYDY